MPVMPRIREVGRAVTRGILMEETISRMDGSTNGSRKEREDLKVTANAVGHLARECITLYGPVLLAREVGA